MSDKIVEALKEVADSKKKGIKIEELSTLEAKRKVCTLKVEKKQYAVSLCYDNSGVEVDIYQRKIFVNRKTWILIANGYIHNGVYHEVQSFIEDILFGK